VSGHFDIASWSVSPEGVFLCARSGAIHSFIAMPINSNCNVEKILWETTSCPLFRFGQVVAGACPRTGFPQWPTGSSIIHSIEST
jgi:hypothetical protein